MQTQASWSTYLALLKRYLSRQRWMALVMSALLLATTVLQLAGPTVLAGFVNALKAWASGADRQPSGGAGWAALLFLLFTLAAEATRATARYCSEVVAWRAANRLRLDLASRVLRHDPDFHQVHPPGELLERIDGDVSLLASFFSSIVVQMAGSLLLLLGVLVAFFRIDIRLGIAYALLAIAAQQCLVWLQKRAVPAFQQARAESADAYGFMGEVIMAGADLQANGATAYILSRFAKQLRPWYRAVALAERHGNLIWATAIFALATGDALAYGLGGALFRAGRLSLGTQYLLLYDAGLLAHSLETFRAQLQELQRAGAAVARVTELASSPIRHDEGSLPLPSGPLSVAFARVSFRYPESTESWALRHLSFRVAAGQVLGIAGRTGSGKSTVARLLFRLYDPQEGRIFLGDTDVRHVQLVDLRRRIGFIPQEVQLFTATLRDNLSLFAEQVPDSRLLAVLTELGLLPWVESLPHGLYTPLSPGALSAGEAQLLACARIFLQSPDLVICDEAASRLDANTELLLNGALRRLMQGRTGVIIAHRWESLDWVDVKVILENGGIAT